VNWNKEKEEKTENRGEKLGKKKKATVFAIKKKTSGRTRGILHRRRNPRKKKGSDSRAGGEKQTKEYLMKGGTWRSSQKSNIKSKKTIPTRASFPWGDSKTPPGGGEIGGLNA